MLSHIWFCFPKLTHPFGHPLHPTSAWSYPPWEVLVFQASNSQAPSDVLAPDKQLTLICKGRKTAWLELHEEQAIKRTEPTAQLSLSTMASQRRAP